MPDNPPEGLTHYRLLAGPDDDSFCRRVSDALALGHHLYGSPVAAFDGERVIVGQALLCQPRPLSGWSSSARERRRTPRMHASIPLSRASSPEDSGGVGGVFA